MIVATYSITDSREEKVSFAGPYFIAGQDLLVRADDESITGPESLDGKRLCSVSGSTSAQTVQEQVPGVNLQEFGTYSECVSALQSNAVDAVTTDDTILAGYAAQPQYQGQLASSAILHRGAVRDRHPEGDVDKCEQINEALTEMIDDGSWQTAFDETPALRASPRGRVTRRSRTPAPDPIRSDSSTIHVPGPQILPGAWSRGPLRKVTMGDMFAEYDVLGAV